MNWWPAPIKITAKTRRRGARCARRVVEREWRGGPRGILQEENRGRTEVGFSDFSRFNSCEIGLNSFGAGQSLRAKFLPGVVWRLGTQVLNRDLLGHWLGGV